MQRQIKGNFDRKHPPDLFRCVFPSAQCGSLLGSDFISKDIVWTRGGSRWDHLSLRQTQDGCCFRLLFKQFLLFFQSGLGPHTIFICIDFAQAASSPQLRGPTNCGFCGTVVRSLKCPFVWCFEEMR